MIVVTQLARLIDTADSRAVEFELPAGVNHRIRNASADASRYLVVQHGGAYDFVENNKEK